MNTLKRTYTAMSKHSVTKYNAVVLFKEQGKI